MRAGLRLAAAGAAIVAALAGCGQGGSSTTTAAPPLTPLQKCTTVVTNLLKQNQEAVEQGYSGGISTQSGMTQYGTESSIFQAFLQLGEAELMYFMQNGVSGGNPPQLLQQACGG
jgi:hypothetical protein